MTIRNRLGRSWPDIVAIGRGSATLENTRPRDDAPHPWLHGPHDLIGTAELQQLTGLAVTALRIVSYDPGFPKPAYVRARSPHTRLWQRSDVLAHLAGTPVTTTERVLQDAYLDAHALAHELGLAPHTIHRGLSGPRIPPPDVHVAGIRLWLRTTISA